MTDISPFCSYASPASMLSKSNTNIYSFFSKSIPATFPRYDTNFVIVPINNISILSRLLSSPDYEPSHIHSPNTQSKIPKSPVYDDKSNREKYKRSCQSLLKPPAIGTSTQTGVNNGLFINKYAVSNKVTFIQSNNSNDKNNSFNLLFQYHQQMILCRICKKDQDRSIDFVEDEPLIELWFTKVTPCFINYTIIPSDEDDHDMHYIIMIGFHTGEIMLWHLFDSVFIRFNKNGMYNSSPVRGIQWIPGTISHFLVAFKNGFVILFDRFKEELSFNFTSPESENVFHIIHPTLSIQNKSNPTSLWNTGNGTITGIMFSPDNKHVAIVGRDGRLKIIDIVSERLIDVFSGYYGSLLCVSWSHDGQFVVTGGEDDLVSIWSFETKKQLARCHGHLSFVSCVTFCPMLDNIPKSIYYIISAGQDGLICLWEFDKKATYPRPRPFSISSKDEINHENMNSPKYQQTDLYNYDTSDRNIPSYFDIPRLEPILTISTPDSEPITHIVCSADSETNKSIWCYCYVRMYSGKILQYKINPF